MTISSGGKLSVGGGSALSQSLTLDGGTLSLSYWNSVTGPVTLTDTSTIAGAGGIPTINSAISGAYGLLTTGNLNLAANNTYTGPTYVKSGSLQIATLNSVSGGTPSSNLGAPTTEADGTISFGSGATAATLNYTGPGETTDRVLNLAGTTGGLVINALGTSGPLKFTSGVTATGLGAKTLTLQGTSPSTGEIGGAIVDSASGATSVTKLSTAAWTLSGANTYSGPTTISAGILRITNPAALYNGVTSNWTPANVTVLGTLIVNAGGVGEFSGSQIGTLFSNLVTVPSVGLEAYSTFGVDTTHATGTVTVSAALKDSTSTGDDPVYFTKFGPGTLELSGANNFTGDINVNAGVLSITGAGQLRMGDYYSNVFIRSDATFNYESSAAQTISGGIVGAGGLTQSGPGTLTLSGYNNYTGVTTVSAGTLVVTGYSIHDTGSLVITGGTVQPITAETVNTLFFGTTQQAVGTWGAAGSGAVHIDNTHFSGSSGVVNVLTGPPASPTYADWATAHGLSGANADSDADPDSDGIANALEFVLGGEPNPSNPNSNSNNLLPTVSQVSGNLMFTFPRSHLSLGLSTVTFQWTTDLKFPSANNVPVGANGSTTNGVTVGITQNSPNADTDTIDITVPAANAVGGKLFGRLNASVP